MSKTEVGKVREAAELLCRYFVCLEGIKREAREERESKEEEKRWRVDRTCARRKEEEEQRMERRRIKENKVRKWQRKRKK